MKNLNIQSVFLIFICFFSFRQTHANDTFQLQSYLLTEEATPTQALYRLLHLLSIPSSNDLDEIVQYTQQHWIQRGKERWQFDLFEEDKRELLIPVFQQIGLTKEIHAIDDHYDYALVYGGFYSRVVERIAYLIAEYERGVRFDQVVFLTGQRLLDPNTNEKSLPFHSETEMMLFVWDQSIMPDEMRNLPFELIDTPQQIKSDGTTGRPTTKDTLLTWLDNHPIPGSCLFISCQPFCGYQDSVARTYLPADFKIETIGPQSPKQLPISIHLDNLARWLYQEKIRRKTAVLK